MKKAIVTGGAGLIGSGICEALIGRGWDVASFDRKTIKSDARQIVCDVGDEASVAAAYAELGWSELDLLVNNAGSPIRTTVRSPNCRWRTGDERWTAI